MKKRKILNMKKVDQEKKNDKAKRKQLARLLRAQIQSSRRYTRTTFPTLCPRNSQLLRKKCLRMSAVQQDLPNLKMLGSPVVVAKYLTRSGSSTETLKSRLLMKLLMKKVSKIQKDQTLLRKRA